MSKNSILGLLIALGLPVACYLWLKSASENAVHMPRKYLLDTVLTKVENGKEITDSVWHKTANITLVNCRSICPKLTFNMQKLQHSFKLGGNVRKKIDTAVVQFVSFTVDPERDSVPVLKNYADIFGANHDNWWFLTGNKDSIYKFAFEELRVDKFSEEPISPDFVHTSRFVLLDKDRYVRGYYNGLDSNSVAKLARDIGLLMLEKDKKNKGAIFRKILDLSWLWLIIISAILFFVVYMRQRRKING